MVKKILCSFIIVLFFSQFIYAQRERKGKPEDFKNYVSWAWQGEFHPYIEAYYGTGVPHHRKFDTTFAPTGSVEFRIGYGETKEVKPLIVSVDERFIFGGYASDKFLKITEAEPGEVETEMWRFGFGNRLGFGYQIGPIGLIPYNQSTFTWTKVKSKRYEGLSENDNEILDRYEGEVRFGNSFEAGAKFQLFHFLAVTGSFEGNIIYPRHLFAKWAASYGIVSIASHLVSVFSEDIVYSAPVIGPLMYFVLKNAISFGYYYMAKDSMNWPIDTETPLTYDTFRISAALEF